MFHNLFIVNRSGGLIYNASLSSSAPSLSVNDWLRIGSTFHSLHAIAAQAAPPTAAPPPPSAGITRIAAGPVTLSCLATVTGLKIVLTAEANAPAVDEALRLVYQL
jgi:hypothetical protein